jgi:hypothetical protein
MFRFHLTANHVGSTVTQQPQDLLIRPDSHQGRRDIERARTSLEASVGSQDHRSLPEAGTHCLHYKSGDRFRNRRLLSFHSGHKLIGLRSLGHGEAVATKPAHHGVRRELSDPLEQPTIGWGRGWVLDSRPRRILEKRGLDVERKRTQHIGRQDYVQAALVVGQEYQVNADGGKVETRIAPFLADFVQYLLGRRFCLRPQVQSALFGMTCKCDPR